MHKIKLFEINADSINHGSHARENATSFPALWGGEMRDPGNEVGENVKIEIGVLAAKSRKYGEPLTVTVCC